MLARPGAECVDRHRALIASLSSELLSLMAGSKQFRTTGWQPDGCNPLILCHPIMLCLHPGDQFFNLASLLRNNSIGPTILGRPVPYYQYDNGRITTGISYSIYDHGALNRAPCFQALLGFHRGWEQGCEAMQQSGDAT